MNLKTKTIEYNFEKKIDTLEEYNIKEQRTATIIFEKENKGMICYWQFKECKYNGLSEIYTEEDWDFLKEVADEIKEIEKELNK